jgi:hypothetical protein
MASTRHQRQRQPLASCGGRRLVAIARDFRPAIREKRLPAEVFELPDDQIALFLRHLWATDGCIHVRSGKGSHNAFFATASVGLARDVAALLLRLGIVARLARGPSVWIVTLRGVDSLTRFLNAVGAFGPRVEQADRLRAALNRGPDGAITSTRYPSTCSALSDPKWLRAVSQLGRWLPCAELPTGERPISVSRRQGR